MEGWQTTAPRAFSATESVVSSTRDSSGNEGPRLSTTVALPRHIHVSRLSTWESISNISSAPSTQGDPVAKVLNFESALQDAPPVMRLPLQPPLQRQPSEQEEEAARLRQRAESAMALLASLRDSSAGPPEAAPTPATSAVEHSPDAADTPTKKVRKAKSKSSASGEPRKARKAKGEAREVPLPAHIHVPVHAAAAHRAATAERHPATPGSKKGTSPDAPPACTPKPLSDPVIQMEADHQFASAMAANLQAPPPMTPDASASARTVSSDTSRISTGRNLALSNTTTRSPPVSKAASPNVPPPKVGPEPLVPDRIYSAISHAPPLRYTPLPVTPVPAAHFSPPPTATAVPQGPSRSPAVSPIRYHEPVPVAAATLSPPKSVPTYPLPSPGLPSPSVASPGALPRTVLTQPGYWSPTPPPTHSPHPASPNPPPGASGPAMPASSSPPAWPSAATGFYFPAQPTLVRASSPTVGNSSPYRPPSYTTETAYAAPAPPAAPPATGYQVVYAGASSMPVLTSTLAPAGYAHSLESISRRSSLYSAGSSITYEVHPPTPHATSAWGPLIPQSPTLRRYSASFQGSFHGAYRPLEHSFPLQQSPTHLVSTSYFGAAPPPTAPAAGGPSYTMPPAYSYVSPMTTAAVYSHPAPYYY
eukprot:EG_transcript_2860